MFLRHLSRYCFVTIIILFSGSAIAQERFTVATYNVNNYLIMEKGTRPLKTREEKNKVQEALLSMNADVIAFQEMGEIAALMELRTELSEKGLLYEYWDHITGYDTNIHVAVLSKFPIIDRTAHTDDRFLLINRRLQVSRGFEEVTFRVNEDYQFTLLNAHLKSKRPVSFADQQDMREKEAEMLRAKVDRFLQRNPDGNLVVLGDFNDTRNTRTLSLLKGGRGRTALTDTRPAEQNGDRGENDHNITWTYHYATEDSYSRFDYILISRGMTAEWDRTNTRIHTMPDWGIASDHRPVIASFFAEER